jgi:lipopolysaccharide export system permease protein
MILTIQKLYIKEFFKVLAVLVFGLSAVFSTINLIDRVDGFMPHDPSTKLLIKYMLFSIPKYIHYLLPMAVLLSSLFIFSQASKNKEIVAIKAGGGRMKNFLVPFVAAGVVLTVFGFGLSEFVVPEASKSVHNIRNAITKNEKGVVFKEDALYIRGKDGSIVQISFYLPDIDVSKGVSIFRFDEVGGLKERINAETGEWENNVWKLKNVTIYDVVRGIAVTVPEIEYPYIESPKIFQEGQRKVEEKTLTELIKHQRRLNEAGFKNIKLTVDISARLSYPLINLFMLLLGISLSLGGAFHKNFREKIMEGGRLGSGIIAAGLGLLISLIYWLGYSFFLSLGYAGTISPIVAPWIMPIVFAGVSIYIYSQIPE